MIKKYVPKIGEECLLFDSTRQEKVRITPLQIGKNWMLADREGEEVPIGLHCEFLPLKTEADLYRKEQLAWLDYLTCDYHNTPNGSTSGIVTYLYNNNVRVLDEGEFVARELSSGQRLKVVQQLPTGYSVDDLFEGIQKAMRRG